MDLSQLLNDYRTKMPPEILDMTAKMMLLKSAERDELLGMLVFFLMCEYSARGEAAEMLKGMLAMNEEGTRQ
jgi:hypothetical protein